MSLSLRVGKDIVQEGHRRFGDPYGAVDQLGDRYFCKVDVVGSIPTGSTLEDENGKE